MGNLRKKKFHAYVCITMLFVFMFSTISWASGTGDVNLALKKNVEVSRTTKDKDHKKVTDGIKNISATGSAWNVKAGDSIIIDLAQSQEFNKITVFEYGANPRFLGYKLEVSEDKTNWSTVSESVKGADGNEPTLCPTDTGVKTNSNHSKGDISFNKVKARYIKLTIKSIITGSTVGYVEEIEVFGGNGSSSDTSGNNEPVKTEPETGSNTEKEEVKPVEVKPEEVKPVPVDTAVDDNSIKVIIDGKKVDFGSDQAPVLAESGRTLVPMRKVFEAFGAQLEWFDETSTVKATKGDLTIVLTIGEKIAKKNGADVTLDQPAELINSRTLVPIRFVAESFGAKVTWVEETKKILISTFDKFGEKRNNVKVLAIGNSFTNDAVEYISNIASADNNNVITVGELTYSASHLFQHWEYASTNAQVYTYAVNNVDVGKKVTMKEILDSQEWDYITLQQVSTNSYKEDTFYPYIENLVKYLRQNEPQAEILLHETWSFEKDSTRFRDGLNVQTLFNAIENTYHNVAAKLGAMSLEDGTKISKDNKPLRIIPSGKAFQIARSTPTYDTSATDSKTTKLNRDGAHASYTYGRFLLSSVWYECLTGNEVANSTYCPEGITQEELNILKKAAHEAVVEYGWQ